MLHSKVSVELGADGSNKEVKVLVYTHDYIIYTANNGSSTATPSTDRRLIFMTNWNGDKNWDLSVHGTLATAASPASPPCAFQYWGWYVKRALVGA